MSAQESERIRHATKHQLSAYVTAAEARRFEALARQHYSLTPMRLLSRLLLEELQRTADVVLTEPYPDTLPTPRRRRARVPAPAPTMRP